MMSVYEKASGPEQLSYYIWTLAVEHLKGSTCLTVTLKMSEVPHWTSLTKVVGEETVEKTRFVMKK
jgi:hypothetical protein